MDGYRPPREMIEAIIAGGKAKLTAYNRAKQEAKRKADAELAEQRRLEAEEAARQEAVAIAAAAATIAAAAALREAGSEQVAAAMETDAMVAVDTARQEAAVAVRAVYCAPVRSAAPAVKGASEVWSGDVTDKAKLIEHIGKMVAAGNESLIGLLDVSQSGINAMAKLQKANLSLPGVRPVCTDRLAVRKQAVSA